MLKKLMILAAVLPMALASAASAAPAQYPPSAGGGTAGGGVSGGSAQNGNGTTLARTGSNTGPLVLVGVALVSVGGVAVVTSRRFRHTS